jgi:hypothetical protein
LVEALCALCLLVPFINPAVSVIESIIKPLPVAPFGGPINGEVAVGTTAEVTLPFTSKVLRQGPVHLKAKRVYD